MSSLSLRHLNTWYPVGSLRWALARGSMSPGAGSEVSRLMLVGALYFLLWFKI